MKKAETQEQEFLEVCSSYDHDLLTGKKEMTLKDYERITYLVSSLGYSQYLQFLIGKYMDLAQADEEREEREHEIYLEYPEYDEDEGILEEEEKWRGCKNSCVYGKQIFLIRNRYVKLCCRINDYAAVEYIFVLTVLPCRKIIYIIFDFFA